MYTRSLHPHPISFFPSNGRPTPGGGKPCIRSRLQQRQLCDGGRIIENHESRVKKHYFEIPRRRCTRRSGCAHPNGTVSVARRSRNPALAPGTPMTHIHRVPDRSADARKSRNQVCDRRRITGWRTASQSTPLPAPPPSRAPHSPKADFSEKIKTPPNRGRTPQPTNREKPQKTPLRRGRNPLRECARVPRHRRSEDGTRSEGAKKLCDRPLFVGMTLRRPKIDRAAPPPPRREMAPTCHDAAADPKFRCICARRRRRRQMSAPPLVADFILQSI